MIDISQSTKVAPAALLPDAALLAMELTGVPALAIVLLPCNARLATGLGLLIWSAGLLCKGTTGLVEVGESPWPGIGAPGGM